MTANSTEYKTLNEASNVASSFGKGWWLERTYLFVCLKVCSEVGVKHGELDLNWPAGGWLVRKPPLLRRAPLLDAHGDRQAVLDAVPEEGKKMSRSRSDVRILGNRFFTPFL